MAENQGTFGNTWKTATMPVNETSPLLRCSRLTRRFGDYTALSDVHFSVARGEILGIIGPNGAGKTTLMECLAGLQPADSGQYWWQGRPFSPLEAGRFLFYLPDGILPYPDQRAGSVIEFYRRLMGAAEMDRDQLVARLELAPVLHKRVRALSKGYRRRLLLAIGLLSPRPLLMLDEPFDGFDLRQSLSVMALLRELLGKRAMLLSIHQLTEAERICHRFLLMDAGRVVAQGTLQELRQQAGLEEGGLEEVFLALV